MMRGRSSSKPLASEPSRAQLKELEREAKDRLALLLDFTKEIATLGRRDNEPITQLRSSANSSRLVFYESSFRELLGLATTDGHAAITLSGNGLSHTTSSIPPAAVANEVPGASAQALSSAGLSPRMSHSSSQPGVWLTLRRPDQAMAASKSQSKAARLARAANAMYAGLFEARQEFLRTGNEHAQLTVGVGIVRWKTPSGTVVDHPLVQIPVELQLANDGALFVRMADAAKASLWLFPGVSEAAPALSQLDACAKDYGLVGSLSPPAPTDRDAWAPLLERAANVLAAGGQYVGGPPSSTDQTNSARSGTGSATRRSKSARLELSVDGLSADKHNVPVVYNTFVLFTRDVEALGEQTVARDAAALSKALREVPAGMLPSALGRLVGIYKLPPAPGCKPPAPDPRTLTRHRGFFSSLVTRILGLGRGQKANGKTGQRSNGTDGSESPFLYFGLPSNTEQESVVATLERQGCAVLVGPPGTGKSQTIANVICHYLASGRRVLVTSKGEPATEVLRNKLPDGIRDLCVSLGSGDTASFRRLEGAVESLANQVAATPLKKLRADADRLRKRFEKVQSDIERIEQADARWASGYFPPTDGEAHPLRILQPLLHSEHLELLGVQESSTMAQLAAAIEGVLGVSPPSRSEQISSSRSNSPSPGVEGDNDSGAASTVTSSFHGPLPVRAFFLEDVEIDPKKPPPTAELIDSLRELRRKCGDALRWETTLQSRNAKAPKADAMDAQHCRELALTLRQRNEVSESIRRGDLPKINNVAKAEILATHLETVCRALEFVEAECGRVTTLYLRKQPHHGSSMGDPQGRRLSLPTSLQPRRPARPGRFSLSPLPMIGMIVSQNFVSALESLASPAWVYDLLRHADNKRAQKAIKNVNVLVAKLDKLYASTASSAKNHTSAAAPKKSPASRVGNEGSESAHASTIEAVADGSIPRHGVSIPRVVLQLIDLPLAHDLDLAGDGSDVSSKVLGEVEFTKEVASRAHPERQGFFHKWRTGVPSQILEAELREVTFDGRHPTTTHEWQNVEQALVERCCASRLREQWALLSTLADNVPKLPSHTAEDINAIISPASRASSLGRGTAAVNADNNDPAHAESEQGAPAKRPRRNASAARNPAGGAGTQSKKPAKSKPTRHRGSSTDRSRSRARKPSPTLENFPSAEESDGDAENSSSEHAEHEHDVQLRVHRGLRQSQAVHLEPPRDFVEFVQAARNVLASAAKAMATCHGLGDAADAAHGKSMHALNAVSRGPQSCREELNDLQQVLQLDSPEAAEALRKKDELIEELGQCERGSPLHALQEATKALGGLRVTADEATRRWLAARNQLRLARGQLIHAQTLKHRAHSDLRKCAPSWAKHFTEYRTSVAGPHDDQESCYWDPCPRDAREIWAAIAAKQAMRDSLRLSERERGSQNGALAAQRLLKQRNAVVRQLVAAVAKEALREVMSEETCAGLIRLVSAVAAAGRSTGKEGSRATRHREDLAAAMNDCARAVPCWIMPTWRVSQCLPAEVASFDLVVLDEASQSDVTALTALMRGTRVLVVGDQKQVSPTAAFIKEDDIVELKARLFASRHPYVEQLLPGRSIFDLAQTCYSTARVALNEHFRCVPQCIALSNEQFYHGRLKPRRLPPQSTRLSPALVDVFVKGGKKVGKVNKVEAAALISYLKQQLKPGGELARRSASVGIISLLGMEQTRVLRQYLLAAVGDEALARHRIVVGDPSSFQGDERDVILLSMVCSRGAAPTQVGRMYEQRYNVALSRARDRMVLFRSLDSKDVASRDDMKVATIQFFKRMASASETGGAAAMAAAAIARRRMGGTAAAKIARGMLANEATAEGQVLAWLDRHGFRYDASCSIAGSLVVVEDNGPNPEDRRLCVCLDGGPGTTLADWKIFMKQQRALEGQGWVFLRMWEAQWAVDRSGCEKVLARACSDAGVRSGLGFDPDHAASPLRPRAQSVAPNSNGVSADDGMSPTSSGEVVRPSGVTSSTSAQSPSGLYDDEDVKLLMRHSSVGANDTALSAVAAKKTRKKGKTNAVLGEPQKPRDPIASMTVPALRDALRELDQDTSGRKSDLVDRLRAAQELENTNGAMMADFVVGAGAPNPKPRKQTAKRKQSTKAKKPVVATKKKRTAGNRRKKKRNNDAWVPSDDE